MPRTVFVVAVNSSPTMATAWRAARLGAGFGAASATLVLGEAWHVYRKFRLPPEATGPTEGVCRAPAPRRTLAAAAALSPAPPRANIVFLGDSLVTGVGCSAEAGAGPTLPRSAAGALAERLGRDVSWAAIGETGADVPMLATKMLPTLRGEVQRCERAGERVDHVVVMCGLNDIKACFLHVQPWRHPGAYRRAMGDLAASIREAAGPQCRVWFPELPLEPAPRFRGIPPLSNLVHTVASLWERQKRQLADGGAPGVGVVDANVARVRMDWYCDDGMHPNDLGYREWGEIIADTIVEVAAPK